MFRLLRLLTPSKLGRLLIVAALALGCGAEAGCSSPGTKHACEVLTEGEIAKVFGGIVTERRREATHASSKCDYEVDTDGKRPPGFVTVQVVFAEAEAAYDDLKKPGSGYTPIPDLSNAISNDTLRIVNVLNGDVLVGVQGIFVENNLEPVPPQFYDVRTELLELARLAVKRL